jgi:plasmid maintenance system antidote protein VapI
MPQQKPIASHKSQTDLAKSLGVSRQRINEMLSGKVGIGKRMALRLEQETGVPVLCWLYPETHRNPYLKSDNTNAQPDAQ